MCSENKFNNDLLKINHFGLVRNDKNTTVNHVKWGVDTNVITFILSGS